MRELSWLWWLATHALASAAIAFAAMLVGPQPINGLPKNITLYGVFVLQLIAVIFIVLAARDRWKLFAGALGFAAMAWGGWCLFVAGMALTGSWL